MSTSSDNTTPSLKSDSAAQVITTNWDSFSALVKESARDEYSQWLDEELIKLEARLDEFVTGRSRYGGRR